MQKPSHCVFELSFVFFSVSCLILQMLATNRSSESFHLDRSLARFCQSGATCLQSCDSHPFCGPFLSCFHPCEFCGSTCMFEACVILQVVSFLHCNMFAAGHVQGLLRAKWPAQRWMDFATCCSIAEILQRSYQRCANLVALLKYCA